MTFDEWWKQTKPAECDELKPYFEEAWQVAAAKSDALQAQLDALIGDDQCPAPSCDECPERGDCTAEENAREAAEGHNANVTGLAPAQEDDK